MGAEFTLSIRQALRYGSSRAPIEDVGVEAQFVHAPTRPRSSPTTTATSSRSRRRSSTPNLAARSTSSGSTTPRSGSSPPAWITSSLELDGIVHTTATAAGAGAVELRLPPDASNRRTEVAGFLNGRPRQRGDCHHAREGPGSCDPAHR